MASVAPIENKQFDGGYLVFRRCKQGLKRKYAGNPRFRHETRHAAEAEAGRLLGIFPDSTFVIVHEVGVLKQGEAA